MGEFWRDMFVVSEILDQADPGDAILPYVMHLLANEDIEGLPPGGGLSSK